MDTFSKDQVVAQEVNPNNELNNYQSVLHFVVGTEQEKKYYIVDARVQQLNGYSNSLLLYEIRAGINAITAARSDLPIQWEHAWLN